MAGTKAGGAKVRRAMLTKDPDWYKKIGAIGGRTDNGNKHKSGFGSYPERAREYGKKYGPHSWDSRKANATSD